MRRTGFTGRIARRAAVRPWLTVGIWVVILAAAVVMASGLGDVLTEDGELTVTTESEQADRLYAEHFGGDDTLEEFVLVEANTLQAGDPAFDAMVDDVADRLRSLATVAGVVSYRDGAPGLVSDDATTALLVVTLQGSGEASDLAAPVVEATEMADAAAGFRVTTIGNGSVNGEFGALAEETLQRGEVIGFPIALVILVLVFGAAVAAGLPIVLALVSIVLAVGMTAVVGQAFELSLFVVNMITMIGLAVGIDYSLFVVQRFREERARGLAVVDSIEMAGDSATRAVFFSGLTVVIALSGLLVMPDTVMRSLGGGAILAVVAAILAALTLLPAVLALLGDRVNKLKVPFASRNHYHEGGGRFWHRVTDIVTARPLISVALAGGLLLAAAAPYLSLHTGQNFIDALPEDSNSRHAFHVLTEEFDTGVLTVPIIVNAGLDEPGVATAVDSLVATLEADAAYGTVAVVPSADGEIVLVDAVTKLDPSTAEAAGAVTELRTATIPGAFAGTGVDVFVSGDAAATADYVGIIDSRTPLIFALVLGLSFLLLMVVFRSLVVPIKAIVMNMLSVGAAYGLLVLVFQWGVGAGLFGFQQTDVIESWIPLFLFAVLFGLSMDYHIFLLSRIKERYDVTGNNDESVAFGLGSTGAIITGAALIMVAVFGGFAAGDLVMFQQMGFGLAVAVILDATIVRSVLVPATMKLLGTRNWYFPAWLGWLPEIHIEGRQVAVPAGDEPEPEPVPA